MLTNKTKKLRNERRLFRNLYSKTSEEIIKGIAKGQTSHEIANQLDVPLTTVVTTRGNFTRGIYYPLAYERDGKVTGTCRF